MRKGFAKKHFAKIFLFDFFQFILYSDLVFM